MMFQLNNKVILITGASSGIGRECAIQCSRLGAIVMLFGRNDERLRETISLMDNSGIHKTFSVDLNDSEKIETIINEMQGSLNGLVHSAGIAATLPFSQNKPEKMAMYFNTNLFSAINLTRLLLKKGKVADGSSLIFISSVMAMLGETGKTLYGMTKGALVAGARSLSIELAPKKIRVNCVSPGVVNTPMSQKSPYSQNETSMERIKQLHPLGLGMPSDVANACVFLLSDEARWITGSNMIIDGGYSAK